ncbi:MAG: hypothetical protein RBU28_04190 [Bacteroidales bacterium]|jgi:hypothetical protein|nr:hypothetical protein [Bacteroidales bacterium]
MKKLHPLITAALLLILLIPWNQADAIPAFARKYQISCQVCHSPAMPGLKAFGDDFAGNGFRMTDYESPRYFIETGDQDLSLFRELPLAIRLDGFASFNFADKGSIDFAAPFVLKILSGGEISDKLSYYFYFLFNERGSVAGVEDAFVMYHDFLSTGINLYLGQFQVSDPLFKGELRFTLEPYHIYGAAPGNSSADLKYDRGVIFEKGFSTGTDIVGEIVNGSGIGEAGEGYLFDKDKYKNFLLRINQSAGQYLSAGFFGYTGKEVLRHPAGPFTSSVKMFGPDVSLNVDDKFIMNLQYVFRTDSKVFLDENESIIDDVRTHGGFAELIYAPRGDMSKWYLTGLFNYVESDIESLDYISATFHAGYLLRRNMRVVAEYTQLMKGNVYGKISAGVITAF